jgi:sugar phosphate isomerase/epimerase
MPAETPRQRSPVPACYLHRGIDCIEYFDYPVNAMAELQAQHAGMRGQGFARLGFHAPMPRMPAFLDDGVACFYLHDDARQRRLSFDLLEHTLQHARDWRADYVVTHLTYGKTDTADPIKAERLADSACRRFAELSREYALPINVEFAAYTRAFHRAEQYIAAVSGHPELGICIDTGHTRLGADLRGRDYFADVAALAPYTRSMHLWNTTGGSGEHIALHPRQNPTAGWIDMEQTLRLVLEHNPDVTLIFEYPVAEVTPEVQAGYDWIKRIRAEFHLNFTVSNRGQSHERI